MASFHCLLAFLLFAVVGAGHGAAKGFRQATSPPASSVFQGILGTQITSSADAEHLICSERGLSFRMDNGMYWSSTPEGIMGQEERDYTCQFQVCMLDSGKVQITDYKNKYLTLDSDVRHIIKTTKSKNKPNTEFVFHYVGDKVELRASNNLLLSRIYYIGIEQHTLEAQKEESDHFTPFTLVTC